MLSQIRFDSINLFVNNMEKTLDFYSLLGFSFDTSAYSKNYVKIDFKGFSLCFYSLNIVKDYFLDNSIYHQNNHQFELSFTLDTPENVDTLFNKVKKSGFSTFKPPSSSDWNQRVAFVLDPDNNLIELNATLK